MEDILLDNDNINITLDEDWNVIVHSKENQTDVTIPGDEFVLAAKILLSIAKFDNIFREKDKPKTSMDNN